MVYVTFEEHELPTIPLDHTAADRECRCGGSPPSVMVRSPRAPGPPGTTRETHVDGETPSAQDLGFDPPAIRLSCASLTRGRRYGPLPSQSMKRVSDCR